MRLCGTIGITGFPANGAGGGFPGLTRLQHLNDQGRNCHQDDCQIPPEGFVFRILDIQLNHFHEGGLVFSANLPEPGQTRHGSKPFLLPGQIFVAFVRQTWARPHQAHFAAQHVDQLGQLIQTRRPEEQAKRDNPGITS